MQYLITIILSVATTFFSMGYVYNNIPLDWSGEEDEIAVGADVTTILGTDTLSNSRSTINTNFSNLNTDLTALQATTSMALVTTMSGLTSASALATIGTITTGTWNADLITVPYGGTGSSTFTSGAILYGNGTGALLSHGPCSDGQFLGFSSSLPACNSTTVDESANYTWTGDHTFSTTTALATTTQFSNAGGLAPTGSVLPYAAATAPDGWLLADGSSLATDDYPDLFAVIGYDYGGAGANFNLPDLQNRVVVMASTTANIGQTGGSQTITLSTGQLPSHSHTMQFNTSAVGGTVEQVENGNDGSGSTVTRGSTGNAGSGNPINTQDPYIVLNYIIKY